MAICATLTSAGVKIAPSTIYAARTRPPSPRARRDEVLKDEIRTVHAENYSAFGARKMHVMLNRPLVAERHGQGHVARCTVERLMRHLGLRGTRRAKTPHTTRSAPREQCPADLETALATATATTDKETTHLSEAQAALAEAQFDGTPTWDAKQEVMKANDALNAARAAQDYAQGRLDGAKALAETATAAAVTAQTRLDGLSDALHAAIDRLSELLDAADNGGNGSTGSTGNGSTGAGSTSTGSTSTGATEIVPITVDPVEETPATPTPGKAKGRHAKAATPKPAAVSAKGLKAASFRAYSF